MDLGIDWSEVVRRALKYLFEGLAVGLASSYIIKNAKLEQAIIVGLTASCTLAVLDLWAPSVGGSARLGMGFATGSQVVGGF